MWKYDKWLISPDLWEEIIRLIKKYNLNIDLLLYKTSLSNYFNEKDTIEKFLIKVMSKKDKYESVMYPIKPIASVLNILINELWLNDEWIQDKKRLLNKIKNDKVIYYFEDHIIQNTFDKFHEYKQLKWCQNIWHEEYWEFCVGYPDNIIISWKVIWNICFFDNNYFYINDKIKEKDNIKFLKHMSDEVKNDFEITEKIKSKNYNKILLKNEIEKLENNKVSFKDWVQILLTPLENRCLNFYFVNNASEATMENIFQKRTWIKSEDSFSKFKTRLNKKIRKYFKLKKVRLKDEYYLWK